MACRAHVLLLLPLLLAVLLSLPSGGDARGRPPGPVSSYQPISDPADSEIQALAKFAVRQHMKVSGERLSLTRVLGGQLEYNKGTNYRLVIGATGPNRVENLYLALVSKMPWLSLKLTAFNMIV